MFVNTLSKIVDDLGNNVPNFGRRFVIFGFATS